MPTHEPFEPLSASYFLHARKPFNAPLLGIFKIQSPYFNSGKGESWLCKFTDMLSKFFFLFRGKNTWVALTSREMAKQASHRTSDLSTKGFSGDAVCIGNLLIAELLPCVPGALWEKYCTRAFLMSKMSHSCNLSPLWFNLNVLFATLWTRLGPWRLTLLVRVHVSSLQHLINRI